MSETRCQMDLLCDGTDAEDEETYGQVQSRLQKVKLVVWVVVVARHKRAERRLTPVIYSGMVVMRSVRRRRAAVSPVLCYRSLVAAVLPRQRPLAVLDYDYEIGCCATRRIKLPRLDSARNTHMRTQTCIGGPSRVYSFTRPNHALPAHCHSATLDAGNK